MTEDEAKTRWCCGAQAVAAMMSGSKTGALCIGSACMAWRWSRDAEWQAKAEAEYRRSGRRIVPTDGYCGLASRPS